MNEINKIQALVDGKINPTTMQLLEHFLEQCILANILDDGAMVFWTENQDITARKINDSHGKNNYKLVIEVVSPGATSNFVITIPENQEPTENKSYSNTKSAVWNAAQQIVVTSATEHDGQMVFKKQTIRLSTLANEILELFDEQVVINAEGHPTIAREIKAALDAALSPTQKMATLEANCGLSHLGANWFYVRTFPVQEQKTISSQAFIRTYHVRHSDWSISKKHDLQIPVASDDLIGTYETLAAYSAAQINEYFKNKKL